MPDRISSGREGKPKKGSFVITVSEDLDCSGLPGTVTVYARMMKVISGLRESFMGGRMSSRRLTAGGTGDRTCRFTVDPKTKKSA